MIKRLGGELLDLIYPPGLYCISCGKITDNSRTYGLCNECMSAANWITERICVKCGKKLSENDTGPMCFSCRERQSGSDPHSFDKGHACTVYGAVEQAVIFAFKYGSRSDIGEILGEVLYDRMVSEYEPDELAGMYDMVIPVPIHRDKKKKRGFDHAAIMAESFAERAGLRSDASVVIRTKTTKPMKGLSPEKRKANISSAFDIRERKLESLDGAHILLIDDIFTTGATIDEIAMLLKHPQRDLGKHDIGASSAHPSGAACVDFLTYAAAADYLIV